MGTRTVEYKDFSFGDYGRIEGFRAPKNSWTGSNMLVYRTGELGVRPGLRNISPSSGLANGVVWQLGSQFGFDRAIWYGQGTAVRKFDVITRTVATFATALTSTPTQVARAEYGSIGYIVTNNSGAYSIDADVTKLTGSMNGGSIALYGARLAIVPANPSYNTIRYSAEANFLSWPVGNTITVGGPDAIGCIVAQRTHLAVMKSQSAFYIITGSLGTSDALRRAVRDGGPEWITPSYEAVVRSNDRILYTPGKETSPAWFDGTRTGRYEHVVFPTIGGYAHAEAMPLDDPEGALFTIPANAGDGSAQASWLFYNGAWTKHAFGVTTNGLMTSLGATYLQDSNGAIATARRGTAFVLTDGGAAAALPKFYSWMPNMDRPGSESDPFSISLERAGDDSSTAVSGSFSLPEWHSEDGTEVRVKTVIVDGRKWNTGSGSTNHFDLTVDAWDLYDTSSVRSSTTSSFDEAASSSATAGTNFRKVFSFGDQGLGSGYQLRFATIRGMSFRRIQVILETTPLQGG